MPGVKTNEVPGTRAVLRHYRMSSTKARQVLDLIRGKDVDLAEEILLATPREGARVVAKVLASAVANARNNDLLDPEDLFVSACYADEGTTLKRWRPRARGRATRIRKRTCHITVIVSRLPEDRLERRRARRATNTAVRSRRVAASRRRGADAVDEGAETPARRRGTARSAAETDEEVLPVEDASSEPEEAAVDETEASSDAEAEDAAPEDADGAAEDADVAAEDADVAAEDADVDDGADETAGAKPRRIRARRKPKAEASEDAGGSVDDQVDAAGADAEEKD
jgi:large subunit ribosomal protein L22